MNKKQIFDLAFIAISASLFICLSEAGLLEKYTGFSLIPVLIAYYIGQFVERKTRTNPDTEVEY